MRVISPLVLLGLCANIAASVVLWQLSPTDSVRMWYPTLFAYAGEHFMLWVIVVLAASAVKFVRNIISRSDSELSSGILTLVLLSGADIVTSIFLSVVVKSVWIDPLVSYLRFRIPAFVVFLTASALVWWCSRRRWSSGSGYRIHK